MINYRFQRDGLNRPNGSNGLNGVHGAGGLRGHGALSFIMYSLLFIISATCFSACCSHSDDTPEPTPQPSPGPTVETGTPISFYGQESEEQDVSQGVKGTRADTRAGMPLSEAGVLSFTVWGYKNMDFNAGVYSDRQEVFPGYIVNWYEGSASSTTTNTNGWEYVNQQTSGDEQTIKYWDWVAKAYRFFAVTGWSGTPPTPPAAYEANKSYGTNGTYGADGTYWTAGTYKTYEISMIADASDADQMNATPFFSHLWFSTGNEVVYPDKQFGKPVVLEFLKPYARVRFIFKYTYPREGTMLSGISFAPTTVGDKIARRGTVTIHYPLEGKEIREWYTITPQTGTGSKELEKFEVDYDPEDDSKKYKTLSSGIMTEDGWYMVLPNNTQGSYTLSVNVNGTDRTAVVPEQYMHWLPGYSYTYIFKITEEGGVEIGWVESAVTPWTEMEADWTVYNW